MSQGNMFRRRLFHTVTFLQRSPTQAYRATVRYRRRVNPDEAGIRKRLRLLASQRSRWGCRRLQVLLKRERGVINHRPMHRLHRDEGLLMRRRKRRSADQLTGFDSPAKMTWSVRGP